MNFLLMQDMVSAVDKVCRPVYRLERVRTAFAINNVVVAITLLSIFLVWRVYKVVEKKRLEHKPV